MEATPLLEAMSQRIARESEVLLARAREQADRIKQETETKAQDRRRNAARLLDTELAQAATQARQRAEAEAHMRVLTTKDTIADEILRDVGARLASIAREPRFAEMLPNLLAEVLADAPPDVTVLVPPAHESRCREWVQAHGGGRTVVGDPKLFDGVAIQDAGPTFRVTNTLTTRLRKRMDALRKRCIEELFPDAGGGA